MFKILDLTVRNFMSVGNATQAVNFDRRDLTLVLGENIDLGGDDSGARNGTGKTTIINALSYALYGQALTNIRKDNLINKTNGKNMLVTVDFELQGMRYRIERGRRPNVLKFYIGDQEQESKDDNSQGDSRETQAEIERLLQMSHDMFRHIVALNTYTEPFLALRSNEQRVIIEQLLGITVLSEKADLLKEQQKFTRDAIQAEEFRIKAVQDANCRIEEQIVSLKRRQTMWLDKHVAEISKLQGAMDQLLQIDIDAEISAHQQRSQWQQSHRDQQELKRQLQRAQQDMDREAGNCDRLQRDMELLKSHKCHACGQGLHDQAHETQLARKQSEYDVAVAQLELHADTHQRTQTQITVLGDLGAEPATFYDKQEDAIHHRSTVANLQEQLNRKTAELDPYAEQIADMTQTALEPIDYSDMNQLVRIREHQEFLHKLLTNKDSYIRKCIIDQNLSYLNSRLSQYLTRIGLPHTVVFQNDLTVNITELGRELDFDNLSRGERNRLILSMSWAFRDVWESLYQPINLLFIDELVDSGMDASGVENALGILKRMTRDTNKSVWLVSHKDELSGRVNNILTVVKENGFTTYNTDVDMV